MIRLILALQISLLGFTVKASEGLDLELQSTAYRWISEGEAPSCGLMRARAEQRKKLIREYRHYVENLPADFDEFFVDSFLLNRYFLDYDLWNAETVEVEHRWLVPEDAKADLFSRKDETYFWLESDGINWVATHSMFPEEAQFEFRAESNEVVTYHTTYFVDSCDPQKTPRMRWYEDANLDLTTTTEKVQNFIEFIEGGLQ